jgi:hypothetical protein
MRVKAASGYLLPADQNSPQEIHRPLSERDLDYLGQEEELDSGQLEGPTQTS